jgi:hypothetical protein
MVAIYWLLLRRCPFSHADVEPYWLKGYLVHVILTTNSCDNPIIAPFPLKNAISCDLSFISCAVLRNQLVIQTDDNRKVAHAPRGNDITSFSATDGIAGFRQPAFPWIVKRGRIPI